MGTSVERTANHTDIWKLGLGYEMPCGPVDGMNPVKVAEAMHEAIDRARRGDGPTFLEMKTYRYRGHSMSDAQLYRSKEEVDEYRKIDPITQVLDTIKAQKYATDAEIEAIDERVKIWLKNAPLLPKNLISHLYNNCMMWYTNKKIIHLSLINYNEYGKNYHDATLK